MVEYEADDAIGAAAARWADDPALEGVVILSPDKDMTQCVREDGRVVCFDRRKSLRIDAAAVRAKFGVSPVSIPDYLALVGDSADGFPGVPGWGAKSAAAVLSRYEHLEGIPERAAQWDASVRGAPTLAANLRDHRAEALLFRELATLSLDAPIPETLDELRWRGVPRAPFMAIVEQLGAPHLRGRVPRWAD
jgi:5'-3' exonuclease